MTVSKILYLRHWKRWLDYFLRGLESNCYQRGLSSRGFLLLATHITEARVLKAKKRIKKFKFKNSDDDDDRKMMMMMMTTIQRRGEIHQGSGYS